jgi:hypothetical protein
MMYARARTRIGYDTESIPVQLSRYDSIFGVPVLHRYLSKRERERDREAKPVLMFKKKSFTFGLQ